MDDSAAVPTTSTSSEAARSQIIATVKYKVTRLIQRFCRTHRATKASTREIILEEESKQKLIVLKNGGNGNPLNLVADYIRWMPIARGIFELLDISDILNLKRSCKALSRTFENYRYHNATTVWNINRRLDAYVKDPIALRRMLARTGGVIGGGFACNFFTPLSGLERTLEIWQQVPGEDWRDHTNAIIDILAQFREQQEYEIGVGARRGLPCEGMGTVRLVELTPAASDHKRSGYCVRFIFTQTPPVDAILANANSSFMFNVITATDAYCLFARQTLLDKYVLFISTPGSRSRRETIGRPYTPLDCVTITADTEHLILIGEWQRHLILGPLRNGRLRPPTVKFVLSVDDILRSPGVLRIPLDIAGVLD